MRFLILSCNTGEGHNSAGYAIKEYFETKGHICELKDALSLWSPETSKWISKGHIFIYRRLPKLFGFGYRFEENHPGKSGDESLMYEIVTKGCRAILEELNSTIYDGVICTHVFPAMMVTELKKRGKIDVKTYFVATDYTCTPGVSEIDMDIFFTPHKELSPDFHRNGIPDERIIPSGIPVKPTFYSKLSKSDAKHKLHLPEDKRIILMACGSIGCGPLKTLSESLSQSVPDDVQLVVICGNNRKLYKQLTKNGHPSNITVVGYTSRMSLYMDAANLIITKPGGLSTTEAAVKGLPMVLINAVPGCETHNLNFFISHEFAATAGNEYELCKIVCSYINREDHLQSISQKLSAFFDFCATETIHENLCHKSQPVKT